MFRQLVGIALLVSTCVASSSQQLPADITAQREAERQRQQSLQERQRFLTSLSRDSENRFSARGRPFVDAVMKHDAAFDLNSIPLAQWMETHDSQEVPWKTRIENSSLRMDQRLEVPYTATVQAKDVNSLVTGDLYFIASLTDASGNSLISPKVVHYALDGKISDDKELRFTDSVLTQPGDYVLHLVLYESRTGRHSAMKRSITVSQTTDDPLPGAGKELPQLEFLDLSDRERGTVFQFFKGLSLPVANKRTIQLELVSLLNPPEQWSDQRQIVRTHMQCMAAALNTLSQVRFAQGLVSLTGLDAAHGSVVFQQPDFDQLNWQELSAVLNKVADDNTVSLSTMENGGGGAFLRESLDRHLTAPPDATKIIVVISGSEVFQSSGSVKSVNVKKNCDCRVYHVRFRYDNRDAYDDVEKILKPLGPKTFDITSPRDFRKAVAEIIRDLNKL